MDNFTIFVKFIDISNSNKIKENGFIIQIEYILQYNMGKTCKTDLFYNMLMAQKHFE